MAIITLDEVKILLGLTTADHDSVIQKIIPMMPSRVADICDNHFFAAGVDVGFIDEERRWSGRFHNYMGEGIYTSQHGGLYTFDGMDFSASTNTIELRNRDSFESEGFADGDEIYVGNSYQNDGYYEMSTVTTDTLTLVSAGASHYGAENVVKAELSGATIFVFVVNWPRDIKPVVASMIRYDYEERPKLNGARSKSLGPWSESYGSNSYGYPEEIISGLPRRTMKVM